MSRRLLELAALRSEEIEVAGEKLWIMEPSAIVNMEYRARRKKDMADGVAFLMHKCVVTEPHGEPVYTLEEAGQIARGREEVWTPIVLAITKWVGLEKKLPSPTTSASTTD